MTDTYYDLLGVSEDASTGEIEDAYRAAIKRVHPDVSDDVDAGERTKRLNKAKQVLTDEEERQRYDRVGHDAYVSGGSAVSSSSDTANAEPDRNPDSDPDSDPDPDPDDADGAASGQKEARERRGGGTNTGHGTGSSDAGGPRGNRRGGRGESNGVSNDWWSGSGNRTDPSGADAGKRTSGADTEKRSSTTGFGDRASNGRSRESGTDTWAGRGRWRSGGGSAERQRSATSDGSSVRGSGEAAGVGSGTPGGDRGGRQSRDRTGPSRASPGPPWQTNRNGEAASSTASGAGGPASTRGGSRTHGADGSSVDWSWNAWEQTRSWAVRQGSGSHGAFDPNRLMPDERSILLLATTFFLYPFFVASVLFPAFPLVARLAVGLCTLFMFAYLLSVPEVAIVVFGLWSILLPAAILLVPGASIFSLAGVIGISVTWVPLGLSVLTLSVLRS